MNRKTKEELNNKLVESIEKIINVSYFDRIESRKSIILDVLNKYEIPLNSLIYRKINDFTNFVEKNQELLIELKDEIFIEEKEKEIVFDNIESKFNVIYNQCLNKKYEEEKKNKPSLSDAIKNVDTNGNILSSKIELIPLKKSKTYNEYLNSNIEERAFVIYNYLFNNFSHRKLDEDIFGLDSEKSKGFHTMRILHSIGLRENHKGMFSSYDINDVIKNVNDDDYNEILEILKHIRDTNNSFNGVNNSTSGKKEEYVETKNIGQATTDKILDKHSNPILNIKSVAKVFSTYIIKNNSEYTSTMIGIFAKWGRGKTFFYNQLKKEIQSKNKKIYFCEFQPWKYQKQESAWAYLYEKILNNYLDNDKIESHSKGILFERKSKVFCKKIKFINKLIKLLIEFIEPTKTYKIYLLNKKRLGIEKLFLGLISLFLLAIWIFMPFSWKINFFGWILGVLGTTGILLLYKSYSFYMKSKGTVSDLIANYGKTKNYSNHLGFQNEIEKELRYLINSYITKEEERLILFIDDLDRCDEKMIIDIMDSLRLVLEDDEINKKLTIITAVDERILLKSIKHKYYSKNEVFNNCEISQKEYIEKFYLIALKLNHLDDNDKIKLVKEYTNVFNERTKKDKETQINLEEDVKKGYLSEIIRKIEKNKFLDEEEKAHIKSEKRLKKLIEKKAVTVLDNDVIKISDNFQEINNEILKEETEEEKELKVLTSHEIKYIEKLVLKYNIDTPRKINMMIQRYLLFKNFIFEELGYEESSYELYISLIFYVLKEEKLKKLIEKYNDSEYDGKIKIDNDEFPVNKDRLIVLVKYAEMVSPF